ncbi:MAG: hypothetical protein U0Z44_12855 [Kouleothrix sp.]
MRAIHHRRHAGWRRRRAAKTGHLRAMVWIRSNCSWRRTAKPAQRGSTFSGPIERHSYRHNANTSTGKIENELIVAEGVLAADGQATTD